MKLKKWQVVVLSLAGLLSLQYLAYLPTPQLYKTSPHNIVFSATSTPLPIIDVFLVCQEITLEVQQGDTLDSIAANYAVSKDYIKQYNHMRTDEVSPGSTLLIQLCSNTPMPTETVAE
jgi:hypothetical protein